MPDQVTIIIMCIYLSPVFLINRDDISKMEYLTMCIKEGMRDHCPVPFIQREFTHSFEMDGNKFPGTLIMQLRVSTFKLCRAA